MLTAARLRRLAPLAILITVTSILTACSADMTGPSAKRRSGYITTSASVESAPASGTGTSKPDSSANAPINTPTTKKSGKGNKTLSSGYNVPAL